MVAILKLDGSGAGPQRHQEDTVAVGLATVDVELDTAIRGIEFRLCGLEGEHDALALELSELRDRRGKAVSDASPLAG